MVWGLVWDLSAVSWSAAPSSADGSAVSGVVSVSWAEALSS